MKNAEPDREASGFAAFAGRASRVAGSPIAFLVAISIIVVWGLTGPLFHFSDGWQLVVNTGTTICTFLLGFLIQYMQNRTGEKTDRVLAHVERIAEADHVEHGEMLRTLLARTAAPSCANVAKVAKVAYDRPARNPKTGRYMKVVKSTREMEASA